MATEQVPGKAPCWAASQPVRLRHPQLRLLLEPDLALCWARVLVPGQLLQMRWQQGLLWEPQWVH